MKKRTHILTKEEILSIKKMRAEGKSTSEIAVELRVTKSTISYWIRRMKAEGIEVPTTRPKGGRPMQLA